MFGIDPNMAGRMNGGMGMNRGGIRRPMVGGGGARPMQNIPRGPNPAESSFNRGTAAGQDMSWMNQPGALENAGGKFNLTGGQMGGGIRPNLPPMPMPSQGGIAAPSPNFGPAVPPNNTAMPGRILDTGGGMGGDMPFEGGPRPLPSIGPMAGPTPRPMMTRPDPMMGRPDPMTIENIIKSKFAGQNSQNGPQFTLR